MCLTGALKKNLAAANNLWVVSQPQTHTAGKAAVAGVPLGVEEQKHTVNAHAHTLVPLSLYHKEPDIISSPFRRFPKCYSS